MHKAEVRQLRFGCGESLQSAFIGKRRHWHEGVTASEKTELLMTEDRAEPGKTSSKG